MHHSMPDNWRLSTWQTHPLLWTGLQRLIWKGPWPDIHWWHDHMRYWIAQSWILQEVGFHHFVPLSFVRVWQPAGLQGVHYCDAWTLITGMSGELQRLQVAVTRLLAILLPSMTSSLWDVTLIERLCIYGVRFLKGKK